MVRETRHLWVGNLPENVREEKIVEHFKRYGRVESVKILPKRGSEGGVAAFVDFVDIKSAQKAHNSINKMGDRDLRTDYNEPGTIPSAARGLDDSLSLGNRGRDVSGSRYRCLKRASDGRERAYDHSAYGHHERGGSFDRQRHYDADYYGSRGTERWRAPGGLGPRGSGRVGGPGAGGGGPGGGRGRSGRRGRGAGAGALLGRAGTTGPAVAAPAGSRRRSGEEARGREPCAREPFALASVVHRDPYREERGRRADRAYHHSRSRSPHSSQSRNPSPQRLAGQASRLPRSPAARAPAAAPPAPTRSAAPAAAAAAGRGRH
ncbi:hypothetical protein ANANG_G00245770 [Anguilla anguilla]|uniref:RRM domain-containing protein n=1 Tax=Anguilla anguilla TaxID=7936 RepID=A0A9D3LRF3_ANGAN|nr:hypothetical protein ANANG_G00245770 [Anguilla anguilla]